MASIITTATTELLIVDSKPEDYFRLAGELESAEFRLTYATTGSNALRLPRLAPYYLWLVNTHLPDMSGIELLELIRSRDPGAACVLVGDVYQEPDEIAARQSGANLYVCKPPRLEWLQALPRNKNSSGTTDRNGGTVPAVSAAKNLPYISVDPSLRSKPDS